MLWVTHITWRGVTLIPHAILPATPVKADLEMPRRRILINEVVSATATQSQKAQLARTLTQSGRLLRRAQHTLVQHMVGLSPDPYATQTRLSLL
jgi:hypothetical protein